MPNPPFPVPAQLVLPGRRPSTDTSRGPVGDDDPVALMWALIDEAQAARAQAEREQVVATAPGGEPQAPGGRERPGGSAPRGAEAEDEAHGIGPGVEQDQEDEIALGDEDGPIMDAEGPAKNLVFYPADRPDTPDVKAPTTGHWTYPNTVAARAQVNYAHGLVAGHTEESRRLWLHVLWCQATRPWEYADGVPVSWQLICPDGSATDTVWGPLAADGLLHVTDYSRARHKSRVYRVPDDLVDGFLRVDTMTPGAPHAFYMTGKKTTKTDKTVMFDDQRNPVAVELWRKAMKMVQYDVVDLDRGTAHVDALWAAYKDAERVHEAAGGFEYAAPVRELLEAAGAATQSEIEKVVRAYEAEHGEPKAPTWLALRKARLQWRNDLAALRSILALKPKKTATDGVYTYKPAYEPQTSGRATAIKGQTQNASHEMQHELRDGLPNVRNYDYRSCQAVLLVELIDRANRHESAPGLSSNWLERYVTNPTAKHAYAARAGVSVGAWKTVLYANLMGATLPKSLSGSGAVAKAIREEVTDAQERLAVYARLRRVIDELHESLSAWHDWIDTVYAHDPKVSSPHRDGGRAVKNAVGQTYHWREVPAKEVWRRKAQLAAHLLQGAEASLVLNLITLGPAYGFEVLANMHDGIVTMGEVPAEAVERASEMAGITRGDLVELTEKPYK